MSTLLFPPDADEDVVYPESDGKPIADNTLQYRWIGTIEGGLEALFSDRPDVFVAGDLLWYPVKGNPGICTAPDALVVFGRPKGDRRSYIQHREEGIAPQVVFEVLSHCNTESEMILKAAFYEQYGVDEYYIYDPDHGRLSGYVRREGALQPIDRMQGWVSPLLQVRFGTSGRDLVLVGPDGTPFVSYVDLVHQRNFDRERADQEQLRADQEQLRADLAQQRAERLALLLREAGIDPDAI